MSNNGSDLPTRVERIEQILEVLANRHLEFEEEHKRLLTSQVLLADAQRLLSDAQRKTEESLAHLSSRVVALIDIADEFIRGRRSPEA